MHHIVFYCDGGATVPENVVTVCSACHGNIHDGNLILTGVAPNRLEWFTLSGAQIGIKPTLGGEQWETEWLDTG